MEPGLNTSLELGLAPAMIYDRYEAKRLGHATYQSSKACRRGHTAERYTCSGNCVVCKRELAQTKHRANSLRRQAAWRAANPNYNKNLYRKLMDLDPQYQSKKYMRNRQAERKRWDALKAENEEYVRLAVQRAKAIRRANRVGKFSIDDVRKLFDSQHGLCIGCKIDLGNKFEVDHIVPISKGGTSNVENIQLMCKFCNQSKGNRSMEDFLKRKAG